MADAQDLKSWASKMACGFESRLRHQLRQSPFARILSSSGHLQLSCFACMGSATFRIVPSVPNESGFSDSKTKLQKGNTCPSNSKRSVNLV